MALSACGGSKGSDEKTIRIEKSDGPVEGAGREYVLINMEGYPQHPVKTFAGRSGKSIDRIVKIDATGDGMHYPVTIDCGAKTIGFNAPMVIDKGMVSGTPVKGSVDRDSRIILQAACAAEWRDSTKIAGSNVGQLWSVEPQRPSDEERNRNRGGSK